MYHVAMTTNSDRRMAVLAKIKELQPCTLPDLGDDDFDLGEDIQWLRKQGLIRTVGKKLFAGRFYTSYEAIS